jgi:hypothetical protein
MAKLPTAEDGYALVLEKISKNKLAQGLGLQKQALTRWHRIPLQHVVSTSELTGVPVEHIIPEIARHVDTVFGRDCRKVLPALIQGFY